MLFAEDIGLWGSISAVIAAVVGPGGFLILAVRAWLNALDKAKQTELAAKSYYDLMSAFVKQLQDESARVIGQYKEADSERMSGRIAIAERDREIASLRQEIAALKSTKRRPQ